MKTTKRGNKIIEKQKYHSKLYYGFLKQCTDQDAKERDVCIQLPKIQLPKNFKGEYTHCLNVINSCWNGMNLKCLASFLRPINSEVSGMYTKTYFNKVTGKYKLSIHGREILNKKRKKSKKYQNENK